MHVFVCVRGGGVESCLVVTQLLTTRRHRQFALRFSFFFYLLEPRRELFRDDETHEIRGESPRARASRKNDATTKRKRRVKKIEKNEGEEDQISAEDFMSSTNSTTSARSALIESAPITWWCW